MRKAIPLLVLVVTAWPVCADAETPTAARKRVEIATEAVRAADHAAQVARKRGEFDSSAAAAATAALKEAELKEAKLAPGKDDAVKEAKRLEGTYELIEAVTGGKPEPKAADVKAFVLKGGKATLKSKDKDEVAEITFDPSKTPAQLDLSPEKGVAMKGIYEAKETDKGLELTIALGKGPDAPRPKDFKGAGEDEVVMRLLRKKAK